MSTGTRLTLSQADALAAKIVAELAPACERIEIAGSVRRRKPTVGDLEILAIPRWGTRPSLDLFAPPEPVDLLDARVAELVHQGMLAPHPECPANGARYKRLWLPDPGLQLDLFLVRPPAEWAVLWLIRTGPADFSRDVVTRLLPRGMHCTDGRIWRMNETVPCPDERAVLALAGLPWIEPEERK